MWVRFLHAGPIGDVAHQVEQRIENPRVVGSSPTVATNNAPVDKLAKSSLSKGEILMWVQIPPGVPFK